MKKVLSLLLAVLMLVSALPVAYATETQDYTQGTAVVYTAPNSEGWTITVPAKLAPGSSGPVTLEGYWPGNKQITVTAQKNVVLTNSINPANQKSLDISFVGISELGSNTERQEFTEYVSVEPIANALFGTWNGYFYYNVGSQELDTIEQLQAKHEFTYYSTMNLAVTDVNNGAIGASADVDKEDAVAGIYTDENGGVNVVLLQDYTETTTISPAVDMTINLGGHILSSTDTVGVNITAGNVAIDGRLNGSTIQAKHTQSTGARTIVVDAGANLTIDGGTYVCNTEGDNSRCIDSSGNLTLTDAAVIGVETTGAIRAVQIAKGTATVSDSTLITNADDGSAYGIVNVGSTTVSNCSINTTANKDSRGINNSAAGTATLSDCSITAKATGGTAYGGCNFGTATVSDCTINAYTNYAPYDSVRQSSVGFGSSVGTTTTLNNCYVMGTHSGVQNQGTLYVNGGTYEGYSHGGFYFTESGTTSYVRNATIRECAMPNGYSDLDTDGGCNYAGFYIGGDVDENNITVYMDNCDIYGSKRPFIFRGTDGEQNNTVYISNSRINKDYTEIGIRIDNDTHRLYIGQNCNFDISNCGIPSWRPQFDMSTVVFETDEVYIMN